MASFLDVHVKAAQLRDRAAGVRAHTERQAAFTKKVEAYLELENRAREKRRGGNENDPACPRYEHVHHDEILKPSDLRLTRPDRALLNPPLQRQYSDMDPPESRGNRPPYPSPPLYGAANEELDLGRRGCRPCHELPQYDTADAKLHFGERGLPLYRDLHPSDAAAKELPFGRRGRRSGCELLLYDGVDMWPELSRHGHRRDHSSPPYHAADDGFNFHGEQHGRIHTHRPENDQLSFSSGYMGLGDYDGGSSNDMYLGPPSPHCRPGLHKSRDMSHHDFNNFEPRLVRSVGCRPEDFVPNIASDTLRTNFDRLKDWLWADYAWSSETVGLDTGSRDTMRNFREAPRRPPLEPGRTGYRSDIGLPPLREPTQDELTKTPRRLTQAKTSHGTFRKEAHNEVDAAKRNRQRLMTPLNKPYPSEEVRSEHPRRGHRDPRRLPIPHVARPGPLVTPYYDAGMGCRSLNTPPYGLVAPSQLSSKAQLPTDAERVSNATAMSDKIGLGCTIELLPQGGEHAHLDPISQNEKDITTHESIPSDTDLKIPGTAARDNPHDIASLSEASVGGTHICESSDSDSGYDTPDDDDDDNDDDDDDGDDSEDLPAGDENAQGGDAGLETVIRIQL